MENQIEQQPEDINLNTEQPHEETPKKNLFTKVRLFISGIVIGLVIATVGTVRAADNAIPGDFLYGADGVLETIRLAVTPGNEAKANLHSKNAEERIEEIATLLEKSGYSSNEIGIALQKLIQSKKAVANLATRDMKLEAKANALDDTFDVSEKKLTNSFKVAKRSLKLQEKQLKIAGLQAKNSGDTKQVVAIDLQIKEIKAQLSVLERQEDSADKALKSEENRLEDLLDDKDMEEEAAEEAKELKEEQEEEEVEELEEAEDTEASEAQEANGETEEAEEAQESEE